MKYQLVIRLATVCREEITTCLKKRGGDRNDRHYTTHILFALTPYTDKSLCLDMYVEVKRDLTFV